MSLPRGSASSSPTTGRWWTGASRATWACRSSTPRGELGHLAVFDERPLPAEPRKLFTFHIFAARAAAELERLSFEKQLRERERQLDSLMGHVPGLAYRALADDHWTALFVSKGIEDLTGYPADEFTSRRLNYADIMLPEDRPATREAVFTALRERRMYEAEHRIRHKDGSIRWIWARGHGVFAPDGSLRFIEGLNLDMTRRSRPRRGCGRASSVGGA